MNTSDDRSSPHDSFASNIFDNQDSLSKGIREYVDSKVAEAMVAYDRKQGRKEQIGGKQTHITFKIDVAGLIKRLEGKIDKKPVPSTTPQPKHICGYTIISPVLVRTLQDIILVIYSLPLGHILRGIGIPTPLVLFLLLAAVVKIEMLYRVSHNENAANILLVPLQLMWEWAQSVARAMIIGLMRMAVECVEEVAGETNVDVDVEVGSKAA
jgi:hypothetical protein